jgi:hypothetical protein
MRMEPVVYLNGKSFTPRKVCPNHTEAPHHCPMNENLELPGVNAEQLEQLEQTVVESKSSEFTGKHAENAFVQLIIKAEAAAGMLSHAGIDKHKEAVCIRSSQRDRRSIVQEQQIDQKLMREQQIPEPPADKGATDEALSKLDMPQPGQVRSASLMAPRMRTVVNAVMAQRKSWCDGQFFKDTFAEHPDDRINYKHDIHLDTEFGGMQCIRGMFDFLQSKSDSEQLNWPAIEYHRLPCADEKALPTLFFDEVVDMIVRHACDKQVDSTAVIFNCQMGKGRTTTGQVVATMVFHMLNNRSLPEDKTLKDSRGERSTVVPAERHPAVLEICSVIPCGEQAVALANSAIDDCAQMQNLRECVEWAWIKHNTEADPGKRPYWISMAENFIQRYCFLVLFAAYCLESGAAPHYFTGPGAPYRSFASFLKVKSSLMQRIAELEATFMGLELDQDD